MRLGRTRLPIPPPDFEREWGNQLIRAIDQNFDASFANIENAAAVTGYYGSFYSTVTQTAAAANTGYAMTFNNTAESNQIAVVSNSRITFKNRGSYNIQFSAQIDQASGSPHYIWIWFRKNGTDIPDSTSKISLQGNKAELIPAWNFIVSVLGGDYVEIMWAVEDTSVELLAEGATAFCPAIPSVIATAIAI
jgi:hypothetical protein